MWMGSITHKQVHDLMPVFAKLTENGWVLPEWLKQLQREVSKRDLASIGVIV